MKRANSNSEENLEEPCSKRPSSELSSEISDPPSTEGNFPLLERQGGTCRLDMFVPDPPSPVDAPKPVKVFIGVYISPTHGMLFSVNPDGTVSPAECVDASRLRKEKFETDIFFLIGSDHTPDGVVADEFGIVIPQCNSFKCRAPTGSKCSTKVFHVNRHGIMLPVCRSGNIHSTYGFRWDSIIFTNIKETRKFLCPEKNQWLYDPQYEDELIHPASAQTPSHAGEGADE